MKKKTSSGQIQTQDFCLPMRIHYLQARCAEDTKKLIWLWAKLPPGVDESCEQSYLREKRKGNNR